MRQSDDKVRVSAGEFAFSQVDLGVVEVVPGVHQDHLAVFFAESPADLAGDAGDERVGRDDGVLGDDCSRGDDGALTDAGVVQDGCADANQHGVFEYTAMDGGVMADGDHLSHDDGV